MYETKHSDGSIGRVNFMVWSEVTSCPECSHEFVLWDVMADTTIGRMKKEFNCPRCSNLLTKNFRCSVGPPLSASNMTGLAETSNISLSQFALVVKSSDPLSGFPLDVESVKLEHQAPSI